MMRALLLFGTAVALALQSTRQEPPRVAWSSLFKSGVTYERFALRSARRAELAEVGRAIRVLPEMQRRLSALDYRPRLLVVGDDDCEDTMYTLPAAAAVVRLSGGQVRVVSRNAGRTILEAVRASDGRQATPTMVLLDDASRPLGCWIERPRELAAIPGLSQRASSTEAGLTLFDMKRNWYRADSGRSTIEELVQLFEAAGAGRSSCDGVRSR